MTRPRPNVQLAPEAPTATVADDRDPEVGTWWWVSGDHPDSKDYDRDGAWLGCITEVGSNYVKLEGVDYSTRIGTTDLYEDCTPEVAPDSFIAGKIGRHRAAVRELMGEIKRTCARLGVPFQRALAAAEASSNALATTAGVGHVLEYKTALVKAKDEDLPALFKQIEREHEQMAKWMKAEMIPVRAELEASKAVTEVIEGKIHTVELYAGLQENLVCVRDGEPAHPDTRVTLMQRRLYMDEECLARYEAGGMDFKDVGEFDAWLAREGNFARILPHDRCIVAFRIRRHDKDYGETTLANFIKFWLYHQANQHTFLYIRNGQQLWRMETSIEFGEALFPKREDSDLLGNTDLWVKPHEHARDMLITGKEHAARVLEWRAERASHAAELKAWRAAGKPEGDWTYVLAKDDRYNHPAGTRLHRRGKPWGGHSIYRDPVEHYTPLTPDSIYYDDAMKRTRTAALEHNRIAVIVQGLLDRSTCLHPHPPWKIWTPEGFAAGLELVYDVSRAITPGEVPSWEVYRAQLNKSLKPGCFTLGQTRAWRAAMQKKYGNKWNESPYVGNGPQKIDMVHDVKRDGSCEFRFSRDRRRPKWVPSDRIGYVKPTWPDIPLSWWCPADALTCIDGYVPGDFHLFYDDARTRADYIQWAPILLAAEDWHHKRRLAAEAAQVDENKAARKAARAARAGKKPKAGST